MIESMNLAILIGSVLVLAAVFTSLFSSRVGAPLLLVFLALGLIAGEDGLGITFDNARVAYFVGSIALAVILFDSGFATSASTLRTAALPAFVLATVGVLVTAGIVGLAARLLFGWGWLESFAMGAIVSSTDAAAVFFLLHVGGITLRERVRATLEVESGSNDPMAIFLTLTLVGLVSIGAEGGATVSALVSQFLLQIGLGAVMGLAGGVLIRETVNRTEFEAGLYPILILAMAMLLFAVTSLAGGSGFLAVYLAGIVTGNSRMRHAFQVRRFSDSLTWLAQIAMFLVLGLLATPSQFVRVLVPAVALGAILIVVARPVAVWVSLAGFRFSRHEVAFVSWVGLRGAVSILLAILPIVAATPNGRTLFNVAFIVVVMSLLVQGSSIAPVARWLGLLVPPRRGPVDRIELELPGRGDHEIVAYKVLPESPVGRGGRIPRWARPALIVRDGHTLRPHRAGRPRPNDQIYIVTTPAYVGLLDRLFAAPAEGAQDPALYGQFVIEPDAPLGQLAASYGAVVSEADGVLTVRDYLRRELAGDIEQGDRVRLGPVDIVVRSVDDKHEIREVGLAVESVPVTRPRIPLFQNPKELRALAAEWFARRRKRRSAAPDSAGTAGHAPEEKAE
jgi:cell volume regulation protein A